jgi:hypothetical protein
MVSSRFYRPRLATLIEADKVFLGSAADAGLNYFEPTELKTRRVISGEYRARDDGEYQISYSFSRAVRRTSFTLKGSISGKAQYGEQGMSFRVLYEFLCRYFNSGDYFIDTYFATIFDTRSVYERFMSLNDSIADAIAEEELSMRQGVRFKKDGTPDMRYNTGKRYSNYKVWQDPVRKNEASRVAEDIKRDIIVCLSTGRIPLRKQHVSPETAKVRARFTALDPNMFFFASGQLIEHLSLFVETRRGA